MAMAKFHLVCSVLMVLIGICLVVGGIVLINVFSQLIKNTIANNMMLKNGSETFQTWKEPPVPVYMQFWLFDLTNKDDVIVNGSKPRLEQRGPYTYREVRVKSYVKFNDNDTLTYRQNKSFIFVPELSVGDDRNDTVTTVNLLYASLANKFQYYNFFVKDFINNGLKAAGQGLFETLSVRHLIWGHRVDALKTISDIIHTFSPSTKIPYDIGLFADVNGTDDGFYTIFTGAGGISQVNKINKYHGSSSLSFWHTRYCNMVNGTDGTAFNPFINKNDSLYVFSSDICRSIYVRYVREVEVYGVTLYRFTPPSEVFGNLTVNPDNAGFCEPTCYTGVLNISVCKDGAPVVMSQPHFYQADPRFVDAVEGLHPDPSQHTTVLDIEPHTGLVLNAGKRLQVNIYLNNIPYFSDTEKLPQTLIYPVAWLNESASLNSESADKFKQKVMRPILITQIIQYSLIGVGVLIVLTVLTLALKRLYSRRSGYESTATKDTTDQDQIKENSSYPLTVIPA